MLDYFDDVFFLTYSESKRGEISIFSKTVGIFFAVHFFFCEQKFPEAKKKKSATVGQNRFFFAFLEFSRDFIFSIKIFFWGRFGRLLVR